MQININGKIIKKLVNFTDTKIIQKVNYLKQKLKF